MTLYVEAVAAAQRELEAARRAVDEACASPENLTVARARELNERLETARLALAWARFELRKASRT